jgi:hypothetical protein
MIIGNIVGIDYNLHEVCSVENRAHGEGINFGGIMQRADDGG